MTIQAILFDLGGVLLRTSDFEPREKLAARLGMSRRELENFIFGGESGYQAQLGTIPVQEHWETLRRQLNVSPQEFKSISDEFFSMDFLDQTLVDYLRQMHRSYKTGLLSNAFGDLRQVIAERWHFEDAFDDMLISAEVGLVKPDPRIYQLAIQRLGVEASQAVFVDDWQPNVDGACQAGLHAIQFLSPQQVQNELAQLLQGQPV